MTHYVLELDSHPPSWVDGSDGDPGRTVCIDRAQRLPTEHLANALAVLLRNQYGRRIRVVKIDDSLKLEST